MMTQKIQKVSEIESVKAVGIWIFWYFFLFVFLFVFFFFFSFSFAFVVCFQVLVSMNWLLPLWWIFLYSNSIIWRTIVVYTNSLHVQTYFRLFCCCIHGNLIVFQFGIVDSFMKLTIRSAENVVGIVQTISSWQVVDTHTHTHISRKKNYARIQSKSMHMDEYTCHSENPLRNSFILAKTIYAISQNMSFACYSTCWTIWLPDN